MNKLAQTIKSKKLNYPDLLKLKIAEREQLLSQLNRKFNLNVTYEETKHVRDEQLEGWFGKLNYPDLLQLRQSNQNELLNIEELFRREDHPIPKNIVTMDMKFDQFAISEITTAIDIDRQFKIVTAQEVNNALLMKDEEYHNHPAMSQSKMKVLLECPRKYYIEHVLGEKIDQSTTSKNLGTCLDLALTEPEKYNNLIAKDCKTTTLEGVITTEWKKKIAAWLPNLYNYRFENDFFEGATFREIIETCTTQDKIFYRYNDMDWRMKTDFLNIENGFFIDLKSTKAISLAEFIKYFFKFGYYRQAASYCIGIKEKYNLSYYPQAYYIAVSTVTGEIFAIKCTEKMIQLGIIEINRGCKIYKHNLATNGWSKDNPLIELDMPMWLEEKIINDSEVA